MGLAGELMRQKFGSQSTACVRVCGDQTDASAGGGIACHAKHCGTLRRQALDDRIKLSWVAGGEDDAVIQDRKSTRLNSSHQIISYAVFCLKKKKYQTLHPTTTTLPTETN